MRSHRPFKVVRYEKYLSVGEAYRREAEIKRMNRAEKELLIRLSGNIFHKALWIRKGWRNKREKSRF